MGIDKYGRIGIFMGGPSTEREISLKSGKAVYETLLDLGLDAVSIDIKTDNVEDVVALIESNGIDCAFLALHGRFGEDGQIQEILDRANIPYTGSGVSASRLAMDKVSSRSIFEKNGLCVPRYKMLDKSSTGKKYLLSGNLGMPLVIKPATHGSSIGLSIIDDIRFLDKAVDLAFKFDQRVIVEEYLHGREVTVGILDDLALPVIEIIPKNRFFDYEAKYRPGMTDYIVPAELDDQIAKKIQSVALSAHLLLGCVGCSRVDLILINKDEPFILEVNTIPGLTETSLLPKAAKLSGIDFAQLCMKLLDLAYEKTKN